MLVKFFISLFLGEGREQGEVFLEVTDLHFWFSLSQNFPNFIMYSHILYKFLYQPQVAGFYPFGI